MTRQGANPYVAPMDDPSLDAYAIPARAGGNHAWMASPYPPAAHVYFAFVVQIAPYSLRVFQAAAALLDLAAGWIVIHTLGRFQIPKRAVLLYLWNPLAVVEFTHAAHLDALMLFWMMSALSLAVQAGAGQPRGHGWSLGSALALAVATLTKGLPALLVPLLLRRWGWRGLLVFGAAVLGALLPFAGRAGWGLSGPLDGRGAFGALRIYQRYWNFNGGIYHWSEVWLSGYRTPGAVPVEAIGEDLLGQLRGLMAAVPALVLLGSGVSLNNSQAALATLLSNPRGFSCGRPNSPCAARANVGSKAGMPSGCKPGCGGGRARILCAAECAGLLSIVRLGLWTLDVGYAASFDWVAAVTFFQAARVRRADWR